LLEAHDVRVFGKSSALRGFCSKVKKEETCISPPQHSMHSLVWGIGLSLGGTVRNAINPARDFGPRLAHAILPSAGKGASDWSYAIVPVLGPLIGGGLAGMFLRAIAK
jgi:glycerol uptake facilitator-like aquaporin